MSEFTPILPQLQRDCMKNAIRFNNEDDDKVFDFTISQKEKDGFKAVLDAFELMKYQE